MNLNRAKSISGAAKGKQQGRSGGRKPRTVDKEKEQQWREVFLRFQSSGLPFKKFCELEKISANTFQYWRRELRSRDEALGISSISAGDNRPADLQEKIDYWLGVIDAINSSAGSVNQFCRRNGIASGSLHFWEKRLISLKLTKGIARTSTPGTSQRDIQFSPVTVHDDEPAISRSENEENSIPDAPDLQADSSVSPIAAELIEPRSGYRVRIFNGADQPTLLALVSALVDRSSGAAI